MLKNIDPILTPELLWVMARMGHGDELAVVDANFPSESIAASTVFGCAVQITGADIHTVVRAVLTLFPLDLFVQKPVTRMEVVDKPSEIPESQKLVVAEVGADRVESLERFAFYEAAKNTCAVVRVAADARPYGCFILKKGVVFLP